ncbi:MAG: MOSC domain-containing protein [Nitrospinae bacterium]|nr:MOSC domain-containing protein [Nitrospinota bacterium]
MTARKIIHGSSVKATLVSLNVGLPVDIVYDGSKTMRSGILKKPSAGKVYLREWGFDGDGSADLVHHRGADKAVCAYCHERYPYWEKELSRPLSPGAFGENLTVSGLTEKTAFIGDIYRLGEAEIQCSQPRQPCHKLSRFLGVQEMACMVRKTGFSGFYFRVLKPGWVEVGDELALVKKGSRKFSIDDANNIMHGADKMNFARLRKIVELKFLSQSWRETFGKRLFNRAPESVEKRLRGPD